MQYNQVTANNKRKIGNAQNWPYFGEMRHKGFSIQAISAVFLVLLAVGMGIYKMNTTGILAGAKKVDAFAVTPTIDLKMEKIVKMMLQLTGMPKMTPTAIISATPVVQQATPKKMPKNDGLRPSAPIPTIPADRQVKSYCEGCQSVRVRARVTNYWPALGGANCFTFIDGKCVSPLRVGVDWRSLPGLAAACPKNFELGATIHLETDNQNFICLDRGGSINCDDSGLCVFDILYPVSAWVEYQDVTVYYLSDPNLSKEIK